MLMLDEDESFWRDEDNDSPTKPAAAAGRKSAMRQDRPPGWQAKSEEDASLDKYLAGMPGVSNMGPESSIINEMLVSVQIAPAVYWLWGGSRVP